MKFPRPLVKAKFLKRYKRFFSEHVLEDGSRVIAHCPNTGAMTGITDIGITSWLSKRDEPKRKLKWTWELVCKNNIFIGVNTHNPNNIIFEAINNKKILKLAGYSNIRREVKYGENSKIDFLLQSDKKKDCYLEIKNVHLSRSKSLAEFPDSVTERGKKHLLELSNVVISGKRALLLFLIQRDDCRSFRIANDIDPKYFESFKKAIDIGVEVLCISSIINSEEINIGRKVKLLL
ncbi:MAG: Sugar fermentation stimulation protein A [Alphaproteobacteria bacterium MarineAlpha9_Bin2]|nr:MAG: Sugar fermentation stimulation protein A [Alphaproteobacteria bacterium MarineAlpha9_Bin2]